MNEITRREFLRLAAAGAAGAAACAFLPRPLFAALGDVAGARQGDPAYAGFNMGLQTYTLRNFDLDTCLKQLKDFGLKYAQFYSGMMKQTTDAAQIASYKEKLAAAGVTILSYGVQGFGKNHDQNKAQFEFAKAMGFKVYTADPAPDSFESLDALTREYGMKIAIHNHGPGDKKYAKLEQVQKAVEKWPEAIGSCVDTGHVLRSGEDPVKWIQALGPRVHDVHIKDFSDANTEHVLGQGKLDVLGVLKALKAVKFGGILALEYEKNPKDPIADIKACLEAVREGCRKL